MGSVRYQLFVGDYEMTSNGQNGEEGVADLNNGHAHTDDLDPRQLNVSIKGSNNMSKKNNDSSILQVKDNLDKEIFALSAGDKEGTDSQNVKPSEKAWEKATKFFEYDPDEHELEYEMGFMDPSNPPVPGYNFYYIQWRTRRFVEHFLIRLLTALLIIIDMILLFFDLFNNKSLVNEPLEYCSLAFSTYFMIEVILRIFGLGPKNFFRAWHNSLDCFLVVLTFILSVVTVCVEDMGANAASLIVALRLIRLIRITRILWERRQLQTGARQFVSQNKRRFQQDGFDLDLTYVTHRVIAMSFPSSGKMSMYRNDIKDVSRFLDTKHRKHYKVYNLCSERHYNEAYFHGSVERFLIADHNVPSLVEMVQFSKSVRQWMAKSEQNVIAVHCKGGKGRTGTMICVILIDSGLFKDAETCLGYFGERRTDKNAGSKFQGVETPSQSRYVGYYERVVLAEGDMPLEIPLSVTKIILKGMQSVGAGDASEFIISIISRSQTIPFQAVVASRKNCKVLINREKGEVVIYILNAPVFKGDTRIMFLANSRKIPNGYENCPFFYWFHTGFILNGRLELNRNELDNPHKTKTWSTFQEDFRVITEFERDTIIKAY